MRKHAVDPPHAFLIEKMDERGMKEFGGCGGGFKPWLTIDLEVQMKNNSFLNILIAVLVIAAAFWAGGRHTAANIYEQQLLDMKLEVNR